MFLPYSSFPFNESRISMIRSKSSSLLNGMPAILYDADSTGAKNHLALAKEIITMNEK